MYHAFFGLSNGLKAPIVVPVGYFAGIVEHIERIEELLHLKRTQYLNNPLRWEKTDFEIVPDNILCEAAIRHNKWVRNVYEGFASWSKEPFPNGEILTPEQAATFWFGLGEIAVPIEQWTQDYYINRMEHLFDVMTGREKSEGVTLDAKKLTPKQAGAVILLFEQYLDRHGTRLSVPKGCDFLTTNYVWCEGCYAAIYAGEPCGKKKCPLVEEE